VGVGPAPGTSCCCQKVPLIVWFGVQHRRRDGHQDAKGQQLTSGTIIAIPLLPTGTVSPRLALSRTSRADTLRTVPGDYRKTQAGSRQNWRERPPCHDAETITNLSDEPGKRCRP
jgi:hypothetical protein